MGLRDWLSRNEDYPARMRGIYLDASKALDDFMLSRGQDGEALRRAGNLLCRGLRELGNNREFWEAVAADAQADPRRAAFRDVGTFIEEHSDKLDILFGKESGTTERILSDIVGSSESIRNLPPNDVVTATLQGRIASFAQQLCDALAQLENTAKSRRRLLGFVRRGLIIAAGVLIVTAGVVASGAVGPIAALALTEIGVGVIVSQLVPD